MLCKLINLIKGTSTNEASSILPAFVNVSLNFHIVLASGTCDDKSKRALRKTTDNFLVFPKFQILENYLKK